MAAHLLSRVSSGDPQAVEECIEQYGRLVWAMACRFSANRSIAEDAVQEIFIDLWKSAGRFDPSRSTESAFIAMIARRRLIDRLRSQNREPVTAELTENILLSSPHAPDIERSTEAKRVLALVDELGEDRKKALMLAVCYGLTHMEVAERLRMPLGTVKTHVRRGLDQIRQKLRIVLETRQVDTAQ